ncbi:thimet oligopeptidase [Trypanosoma cruzi]|nr:thimet oligopeptidase [Trypanosoma cruzi]
MSGSASGIESLPHRQAPLMRCTRLLFFWASFQYGHPTAVRKPTCQAVTQSCGRDRAMTASASAVTLRGIPQCHGEHLKPTVRTRSTSESGTVQLSSVTASCAASEPRRSDSIAEGSLWRQELVWAIGMLLPGGELGTVCGQAQWQGTPLGRCIRSCRQLRGETPQGARLSGE